MEIRDLDQLGSRPAALLLDAAGTLIRTAEPVGVSYARMARAHGIQLDPQALAMAFAGIWASEPLPTRSHPQPSPDDDRSWWFGLVEKVFAAAGAGDSGWRDRFPACFDQIFSWFGSGRAWRLYDDASEALTLWQGRYRLLVVSNFDQRLLTVLSELGILDLFQAVVLSSQVGAAKPAPEIFSAAIERAGEPAHRCLHIGDDPQRDVAGAVAAGLRVYRVNRPQTDLLKLAGFLEQCPP